MKRHSNTLIALHPAWWSSRSRRQVVWACSRFRLLRGDDGSKAHVRSPPHRDRVDLIHGIEKGGAVTDVDVSRLGGTYEGNRRAQIAARDETIEFLDPHLKADGE